MQKEHEYSDYEEDDDDALRPSLSDSGYEKEVKPVKLVVAPGHHTDIRIDRYLTDAVQNASRNKVQKAVKEGLVLVNGKPVKASYLVQPGDEIYAEMMKPKIPDLAPEPLDLDIIYEDDALLLVNKPAGMVVHPAYGNWTGTLVNGLLYHVQELSATGGESGRPGIVHRIDKGTSGLLVVAKTDEAHRQLSAQFYDHSIQRSYWAVVWGRPPEEGRFDGNIGRSPRDRKVMAVLEPDKGKEAITHYRVLEYFDYLSLVEVRLETGRTHQIRVHFSQAGYPVLGDETYGGTSVRYGDNTGFRKQLFSKMMKRLGRQCLHAKTLGFAHPSSGENVRFESDLPQDFAYVLEQLREYFGE
ncbi:MAG: RluA family pseudouridine synthase [Cyclonatronaceae bacterium]